nr:hypothetical protein [Tanacetum cinerariifolium]
MQTRSSSKFVGEPSTNPTSTNPKRRNRRRSKKRVKPFSLEESPIVTMAGQRTMMKLLRAPTEGYAKAIVVPPIPAEHFELKHKIASVVASAMTVMFKQHQVTPPAASVKAVEESCVTYGGAYVFLLYPFVKDNLLILYGVDEDLTNLAKPVAPTTAEQRLARKNELKARGTLLMALPDKHQLKFNSHNDAKTLMEAIEKRHYYTKHSLCPLLTLTTLLSQLVLLPVFLPQSSCTQLDNDDLKQIDADDLEEIDLKWECRSPKDSRRNGSYDWSFQAKEEPANYALMAFSYSSSFSDNEVVSCSKACTKAYAQLQSHYAKLTADFQKSQFDVISYQIGLKSVEARLLVYKQNESIFEEDIKLLKLESDESWAPSSLYDKFQSSDGYHVVPPPYTRTFMPTIPDLVFNNAPNDVKTDHLAFTAKLSPTKPDQDLSLTNRSSAPIIEDWVSDSEDESETKTPQISKPVPITGVRPVSTVVPKTSVTRPKQVQPIVTKTNSPPKRHTNRSPSPKSSTSPPRVTAVKALVVSAAQGMQGKWEWRLKCPILNHGNPQHALKDNEVIDSGCSRHMTRNMSSLSDFIELNGGYFAFGGNLVRGLPTKVFENDNTCVACKKGKQHRASCKTKHVSSVEQPLYKLHMDLFGPTFIKSLNKKSYCLVVTDDYSRSDNGTEFKNNDLNQFYGMKGIKREFSVPRTPQYNRIAERKNRILIEATRTMLADSLLPIPFWVEAVNNACYVEAVNNACYVQNRVLVTQPHNKTPYELLHGRTPSIGFMRPFGCPVTILNTLDSLGKFDRKVDEGFLVGYSVSSKAFRVFNSRTRIVQETLHVNILENKPNVAGFQDKYDAEKAREESDQQYVLFPVWSSSSTNPHNTDGDAAFDGKEPKFDEKSMSLKSMFLQAVVLSQISPNSTNTFSVAGPSNVVASPSHGKSSCIDACQLYDDPDMPELEDITYSDDEDDVGSKADFNNLETSIIGSPIPTTRVHTDHLVTQIIEFEDPDHPNKVYKMVKALYGLHQAPRAWKFRLTDGKSASTPIYTEKPLLKDPDGEDVDMHTYISMIGSLMYLTSSRPDIM